MKNEVLAHLHDILESGRSIKTFIEGKTFKDYGADEQLRSAVERKFEIIGEALNRINRDAPDVLSSIRNHREIISFRNILVHGYDAIDERIVWGVMEDHLDSLLEDVERLLDRSRGG